MKLRPCKAEVGVREKPTSLHSSPRCDAVLVLLETCLQSTEPGNMARPDRFRFPAPTHKKRFQKQSAGFLRFPSKPPRKSKGYQNKGVLLGGRSTLSESQRRASERRDQALHTR